MGRPIDERLWDEWRARLARYQRWAGTVVVFCGREGVSAVALYQWRRKLGHGRAANASPRPVQFGRRTKAGQKNDRVMKAERTIGVHEVRRRDNKTCNTNGDAVKRAPILGCRAGQDIATNA